MDVDTAGKNFHGIITPGRAFLREHWKRLLRIRERLRFSEETFHLLLAGMVGVIGGLTNLLFYFGTRLMSWWSGSVRMDVVELAYSLQPWERVLVPAIGGLGAGLVLYWGLRLAGPQRSNNLLEVVVAGDGRLQMRSALVKALSSGSL